MKQIVILVAVLFFGMSASSQQLIFKKGTLAAGKFSGNAALEELLVGKVQVTDKAGAVYQFVSADFALSNKQSKRLNFNLTKPEFTQEQMSKVGRLSTEGVIYIFSNVVVRNSAGKEFKIAKVQFEYSGNTQ